MAYFYNFNFDENTMYCMPIAKMSEASSNHKRWISIAKEHDTIPRTTNPYVEGYVTYKVHEFPEIMYKRCFWMEERDDEKAEEIKRRYLEERAKKKENKCEFCDAEENKDIFFNFLPAMFGIEKENHDYNPDVTVFITDDNELELCVMMGDDYLLKEKKKIKYCPFCGRRLHND